MIATVRDADPGPSHQTPHDVCSSDSICVLGKPEVQTLLNTAQIELPQTQSRGTNLSQQAGKRMENGRTGSKAVEM